MKIFTNPINFIYIYLLVITKIPTTFLIACSNNHINMPIIIILVLVEIYWYFGTDMYAFYRDMMLRWRQSLNMFSGGKAERNLHKNNRRTLRSNCVFHPLQKQTTTVSESHNFKHRNLIASPLLHCFLSKPGCNTDDG